MYFESFEAFLAMGNHGFYVWLSYGVSFSLIVFSLWGAWRQDRRARDEVKRLLRRESANSVESGG